MKNVELYRRYIDHANRSIHQGKQGPALRYLKRASQIAPETAEAHCEMGVLFTALKQVAPAEEAFRLAIAYMPEYVESYHHLVSLLCSQKRYEEAVTIFRCAIELEPTDVNAHFGLGVTLFDLGRYEEALPPLLRAVELYPRKAKAYEWIGDVLQLLGRHLDAITHYEKARQLEPGNLNYEAAIGKSLCELEDWQAGNCWSCRMSCNVILNMHGSHFVMARAYYVHKQFENACVYYRRTIELQPDAPNPRREYAHALYDSGDYTTAIRVYQDALRLFPEDVPTYQGLALMQMQEKRFEEAEITIQKALHLDPKDPETQLFEVMILHVRQQHQEVEAKLRLLVQNFPTHSIFYDLLGGTLEHLGHIDESG